MRKIILPFLSMLALLFIAMPSYAETAWYLDQTSGSDQPNCNDSATPCQDISYIMGTLFTGGDTIFIRGTYTLSLPIDFSSDKSGSSSSYSKIATWPGNSQAIITGNNSVVHAFGFTNNNSYWQLVNLSITGTTQDAIVTNINASHIVLRNLKIYNNKGLAINFSNTSNSLVKNNLIFNNNSKTGSATIADINGSANRFFNNSLYNNKKVLGASNVAAFGIVNATDISLVNNIIAVSDYAIAIDSTSGILASNYNNFYGLIATTAQVAGNGYITLADWQAISGFDANSKTVDPLFVNTTTDTENLHLQTSSPMIDAGTTIVDVPDDYDDETRPYGTAYDIGADELPIPSAPTLPIVSDTTTTAATLSWTASPTTTSAYILDYSLNSDFSNSTSVMGLTATTYAFTGLTANTTYYYRIAAVYTGLIDYSSAYLTGSFTTAPDAPINVVASTRKAKTIILTWDIPTGTIAGYKVYYSTSADSLNNLYMDVTTNTAEFTDLTSNTPYYFAVYASNGTLSSIASTTLEARTKPAKVKNVKSLKKYLTATTAKIKWKKPTNNTGLTYRVKLMNKKGKKIHIYKATKLHKAFSKLKAFTTYKVKVRAKYDADNKGAWSKVVKIRTLAE